MIQSIAVLLVLLGLGILIFQMRRKHGTHEDAIRREKSDIATLTRMTATMSTFADGRRKETLLAASEDTRLFFCRLIVNGKVAARYTIALDNLEMADIVINGQKRVWDYRSAHTSPQLRANDIAMQIRQDTHPDDYNAMQDIALHVYFKTEHGIRKKLPIQICNKPTKQERDVLPKTFKNAVWWQQYLTALAATPKDAELLELTTDTSS